MSEQAITLLAEVAEQVKSQDVRAQLIEILVHREVQARVALLDAALEKRFEAIKELKKIQKPDGPELFDALGVKLEQTYSKERLQAIKKAEDHLDHLEHCIEKALSGDFKALKEMK